MPVIIIQNLKAVNSDECSDFFYAGAAVVHFIEDDKVKD
jgi:hypothetical protein